jgi:hypothetical protein
MPERHADLFEVGFDQVGQDARVDLMVRASYCPRSIAFSHWATFILAPAHGSTLMMVPRRLRVQVGSVGRPLWVEAVRKL